MGDVPGARPRQLRGARAARHPPAARGEVGRGGGGDALGARAAARLRPRVPDPGRHLRPRRKDRRGHPELQEGARGRRRQRARAAGARRGAARREAARRRARRGRGRAQGRRAESLRARSQGAEPARPAPLRRGRCRGGPADRWRPQRSQGQLPQGDDRRAAPRPRQGGRAARGDPRASRERRGGEPTGACSTCTSASPTSSSGATRTPRARSGRHSRRAIRRTPTC